MKRTIDIIVALFWIGFFTSGIYGYTHQESQSAVAVFQLFVAAFTLFLFASAGIRIAMAIRATKPRR